MKIKRSLVELLVCSVFMVLGNYAMATAKSLSVSDVRCCQRYPWNGLVDVRFTINCNDASANVHVRVLAWDRQNSQSLQVKTLWHDENLPDDLGEHVLHVGSNHLIWDFGFDNSNVVSEDVVVTVEAYVGRAQYMVIDLSEGTHGRTYPVSYLEQAPENGWTDEYKTDKMVLRYIGSGSFVMGNHVQTESGYENDTKHEVVLTRPFYMGVFEVTQRQWELVLGSRPSYYENDTCYRTRPVESVSFGAVRGSLKGAGFPASNSVDATSFIGYLRDKTNVTSLDLPTEAQWEYACRANTNWYGGVHGGGVDLTYHGSPENYPLWNPLDGNTREVSTNLGTIAVGTLAPNAWGLYDMIGNVAEWCLDRYANDLGTKSVVDPVGPDAGKYHVVRGGSWAGVGYYGYSCSPYSRANFEVQRSWYVGVRVRADVFDSVDDNAADRLTSCSSGPIALDSRMGCRIARFEERLVGANLWDGLASPSIKIGERRLAFSDGTAIWPAGSGQPGRYDVVQTSGDETMSAQFVIVSNNAVVHRGRLVNSEIWRADKVHVVASSVVVPRGLSLSIERGSVIKFMEDTKLTIQPGGRCVASGVIFTDVNDDEVGGDTLQDGDEVIPVSGAYEIEGEIDDSDAIYRYFRPSIAHLSFNQRYPWNGLVDIDFEVKCHDKLTNVYVFVSAQDKATNKELVVKSIDFGDQDYATYHRYNTSAYGDGFWTAVRAGWHRFVWDCGRDNPELVSKQVSVSISYGLGFNKYSTRKN